MIDSARDVAKQLKTALDKLGKADGSDDEADGIVIGLDLGMLGGFAGVSSWLDETASDRAVHELFSLGISDTSSFFDHANERAAAYAKDRAAELVTDIDESTCNMLRSVIADGLDARDMRGDIIDSIME